MRLAVGAAALPWTSSVESLPAAGPAEGAETELPFTLTLIAAARRTRALVLRPAA